jgi:hypothetical protein
MIAMGGAIGVGLFMGAGGRLASTGPALIFSYAIAGVIAYLLMRALGELIMYRQTSGSFVSYAGEMFGKKGAYLSGWMYFINWGMTGIAELIAIGLYFQFFFPNVPVEASAIAALALLVAVNLLSVKAFGEFEFWASCLKVGAILIFLAVGTFMVVTNAQVGDGHASVANLFAAEGGMFPKGALVMVLVLNAVIFAYNGIELVGITAGEMQDPEREVPKAVRAVVLRIVVFYVGSVTLLAMLLPSDQYVAGTSPFVTVFGQMGLAWVGDVMNMIVITAALVLLQLGPVLHRPRVPHHGQQRPRTPVAHQNVQAARPVRGHPRHRGVLPGRHPAQHLAGRFLRVRPGAQLGLHRRDLLLGRHLRQPDCAAAPQGRHLQPADARFAVDQLGGPGRPARHHGAHRFRHHDQQERRGLLPGPLDPGHHPVLRPGPVAGLAEGQEQRAQERAVQLAPLTAGGWLSLPKPTAGHPFGAARRLAFPVHSSPLLAAGNPTDCRSGRFPGAKPGWSVRRAVLRLSDIGRSGPQSAATPRGQTPGRGRFP